ncbi:PREDICTED: uncharacterized protein LOC109210277 [Nicotiana attenuata]|uniref:uncharacterized protein LOC109210277 n=1 Tax=Nicotiana attenuata TaxID=49451 RepID=UPI0009057A28|nr:PREDICTED: uncharacterized protein LOC109210277 [Nicotiana attenuata]
MASLTVLLRHFGKWNDEGNYIDFSIEGILIKEYASFNDLVASISNQVDLISGGSLNQGDIVQIDEAVQRYDSDTDDTLALDFVNSGEAIGVFELHKDLIISKTNQKEVMSGYCEWRFKASSINKSELFKVREFNDNHTCPLKDKVYEQRQASSSLIGGMISPKLTNHKRKYTPRDITDDVKSDFGVDVSYMLAWRAKEKAMNFLRGEPADSYKKLPGYLYTMDMTYPGSHIRMASTLDGAGHILPLAYGVIDYENDAAWTWFFEKFKIAYGERENMCIVSDRNESIIKSVSRVYPDVLHFACIWHLWNNVYKKFKKSHAKLSEIYFSMAKAYTQAEFDSLMEKVEKVDIRVKEYLELAGYEKWARLYAPVNRGWTMTSNIAESINAALVSARELPIYNFLEEVRKMFGRWNCSNRKEATQTYTTLGKKYPEMLTLNEGMSTRMAVVPSTEYLHTVNDGGRNYTVCLLERKCVCGRFQVDELPCPHAWAVLKSKFLMPDGSANY